MYINPDGATTRTAAETAGRGPVFDQALSTVTAASALMWVTSRIVTHAGRVDREIPRTEIIGISRVGICLWPTKLGPGVSWSRVVLRCFDVV